MKTELLTDFESLNWLPIFIFFVAFLLVSLFALLLLLLFIF